MGFPRIKISCLFPAAIHLSYMLHTYVHPCDPGPRAEQNQLTLLKYYNISRLCVSA